MLAKRAGMPYIRRTPADQKTGSGVERTDLSHEQP